MHTHRKALWAVRQSALPTVVRPCPDCAGDRHRPSGKIRVNANGKLLDVWLLLSCVRCDRTSKVTVHDRAHVSSLDPARLVAYENNDAGVVRELAMSASLAARSGYRLDWTGTWSVETHTPLRALDDVTPLTVRVAFELPAPVRVERLLMLGLGASRAAVRRMVADGQVRLPLALDAKAHRDFELTVHPAAAAIEENLTNPPRSSATVERSEVLLHSPLSLPRVLRGRASARRPESSTLPDSQHDHDQHDFLASSRDDPAMPHAHKKWNQS